MMNFFKDAYKEFKKVQWPSKQETKRLTGYVLGISAFVGIFVTAIDYVFQTMLTNFLN